MAPSSSNKAPIMVERFAKPGTSGMSFHTRPDHPCKDGSLMQASLPSSVSSNALAHFVPSLVHHTHPLLLPNHTQVSKTRSWYLCHGGECNNPFSRLQVFGPACTTQLASLFCYRILAKASTLSHEHTRSLSNPHPNVDLENRRQLKLAIIFIHTIFARHTH